MPTTEARTELSRVLARFRQEGIAAVPVVFGDHRRPEGVLLPYELFERIEQAVEQAQFEAATAVVERIERVIANPETAVRANRRPRSR
jgi:PHD/YefM family antitoxin component YafN of YafNO toxin-antitoxin module